MSIAYNLILGNITFAPTETPNLLDSFGGTQMLAKHDFPGGYRTIQPLGAFPHPIKWEGHLFEDVASYTITGLQIPLASPISGPGGNIFKRVAQLDQLRVSGTPIQCSYATFLLTVVVEDFKPMPRQYNYIPYSITLMPQQDLSSSSFTTQSIPVAPAIPRP